MPDPARIAQAQVLEIPVTIQGEKAVDETGRREPFAESTQTTLTFDNGAVVKLQARVKAGESVSLRNEKSGKEIQCKVLEAPAEGQLGYTDLEFVETVADFWEGHAEQAERAGEKPEAGVAKSDAESVAEKAETAAEQPELAAPAAEPESAASAEPAGEKPEPAQPEAVAEQPEPAAAAAEVEGAPNAEPAAEKHVPATSKAAALVAKAVAALEAVVAAQPEVRAHEETEAAADNSLAMMSATASETKLPPVKAPEEEPEEQKPQVQKPQAQKPQGRLREELVPAHEVVSVPETSTAPVALATQPAPPSPSATDPTGEAIDAALRSIGLLAHPQGGAEPNDAKDEANLAALMAREARLAKYAALKDKAASQIGRGQAPHGASKGAEAAKGEAGASVEGEAEVGAEAEAEAGPPKVPLSERLTTGKNAVIVEIIAGVAIVVALGFIWHAVRGVFIHPGYRPAAVAAAPVKKAVPPQALPVVVQTRAASVAKVPGATPTAPVNAAAATAAKPIVAASAPVAKIVPSSPARSGAAEDDGPRVVEPPPVSAEPKSEAPVAPKAPENVAAKILSGPQPPFPAWAKNLDVNSVVKLDAVIDEKGNLGEMKIVYGPRLLERAAQQAVQLWIFEPAQLGGKPAESHMVLTVEFQR